MDDQDTYRNPSSRLLPRKPSPLWQWVPAGHYVDEHTGCVYQDGTGPKAHPSVD